MIPSAMSNFNKLPKTSEKKSVSISHKIAQLHLYILMNFCKSLAFPHVFLYNLAVRY